jgi:hypothetical protein
MKVSTLFTVFACVVTSEAISPEVLEIRADSCRNFTQLGSFFNMTGTTMPFGSPLYFAPNPSNTSCLAPVIGVHEVDPTLNITTDSTLDDTILSLISNRTNYNFWSVEGELDYKIAGIGGLLLPAGESGVLTFTPNMTCVNGTLENRAGTNTSAADGVQACTALYNGPDESWEDPSWVNLLGTLQMITATGVVNIVPGQPLSMIKTLQAPTKSDSMNMDERRKFWSIICVLGIAIFLG